MEFQRMYKPGGTFVLTVGDTCARVRDRFRDKWGRWTSQSFLGSAGSVITIVSAYQVVTDSPAPGLTTAASQQHSLLIQEQDDVIHPRQAFRRDLQKYLLKCRQAGHEILLVGDFNEEIGCEADGMISVMNALGMIDIMRHHHRTTLPATYARGSRCLDYALATPKVVESVRKSGYEALSKLEPRILRSNHRQQVTAYIRRKYKILEDHNVFRRIDQLTWLGDRHAFAERLDKDVVEASLAAEKSIQRVGTAPWSVALTKRDKSADINKMSVDGKTRLNNEAIIRTAWSKAGLANDPPVTEKECTRELKEARQQVRSIISEQYGRRDSERMSRITCLEASTSSKDHAQAKVLRQLHKAEALNRLFGKLRRLQEKSERSGISRIEIPVHPDQDPKTCTEWRQVDVPTEVIEQLRQRNRRHFGQADGTPFTVAPLRDQLGYCGDGPEADHILSGRYKYPAGMDSDVQRVIQHLQISDELASMRVYPTISKEDYVGKLKAWQPGNIKIHRTRIIHIYEADYNLMLGLKWRSALLQAEAYDQLNSGQYGSRPKRTAIDPVFLEELQLEMSRITRKTMILTNYDATACYDRIIPNLAMLASRRFGVPREVTLSNARTLEHTDYRIRTELGLATEGYQHTSDQPIYGTGQGSGNSPVIWCFLSSILYDCYDEVAFKAAYLSPNRERRTELGMIGFVDDSNGQTNAFEDPETIHTPKQILQKMKANATAWSRLLAVSGGSLELSKCSYHVLTWKFTASGSPVLYNDRENYGTVTVPDALAGEDQELQYLSTYEAHKTLGHYKEPAGTQRVQFKKLQDKSKELTSFLWSTNLTREESWTFYFATYLPSMSYPLANSHFTERQLTQIQRKAMSIIFAKCGYNRNMKREILYGPLEYGGSNFRRLYDQQGIGQIRLFLRHWRSNTPVGDMLRILLEWCQYAAGISISILEDVTTPLPHLDSKWIASLRHYLANIRASIHVDSGIVPHLEREHDSFIMDWVVHSGKFTAGEIRRINYCRLFLQVVTISDLVTVDGTYLDLSKVEGAPSLQSSRTRWIQIHQDKPSTPTWKLWKKANRLWSNSSGKLLQPLGPFLRDHRERRMEYFSYGYRNKVAIRTVDGYVECLNTTNGKLKETGKLLSYNHLPRSAARLPSECWKHQMSGNFSVKRLKEPKSHRFLSRERSNNLLRN
ncbi:hypothetical protein MHU86_16911 [Fragilaria crotonensis]|nr:hypothetical protein MHU86_16911 [Fragilaria crotonensis]